MQEYGIVLWFAYWSWNLDQNNDVPEWQTEYKINVQASKMWFVVVAFLSLSVIKYWIQGKLGPAGPRDLNDAILEPVRETLRVRSRQAALAEVIDELDDGTDASESDVE